MELREIIYFKATDGNKTVLLPFALMEGENKELLMPWLSGYCSLPKSVDDRLGLPFYQHWGQGYSSYLSVGEDLCGIKVTAQMIGDFWEFHDLATLEHVEWVTERGEYVYARTQKEATRLAVSLDEPNPKPTKSGYPFEVGWYYLKGDDGTRQMARNKRDAADKFSIALNCDINIGNILTEKEYNQQQ